MHNIGDAMGRDKEISRAEAAQLREALSELDADRDRLQVSVILQESMFLFVIPQSVCWASW